ncbi:MAG: response regulator [Thermodesulfobacteriota bacterium]|nr:response regulator [Thermodesulfobacteriota bacterium]
MNEKSTGMQTKILIIDDDKAIADILKELLADGMRLLDVCYDGLSAIENMKKRIYDLIIVDLIMPGAGGLEILKYAKKINLDVIVIIMTGYASLETAIMAIKEGAYDYIRKPYKLEEFKIVVENAIDKIILNREKKELLIKLQDAYNELKVLKNDKGENEKIANINFFSSNIPSLHYLYNNNSPADNYVDKLQILHSLKENGTLTDSEFKEFKRHFLKTIAASQ